MTYAGFWKRAAALLIDGLLLSPACAIISSLFTLGQDTVMMYETQQYIWVSVFVNWIYYAAMESSEHQATLGKLIVGIKVTDRYGKRISFGRATARHFAKIVSIVILFIGFFMAGFTEKEQALHDMVAGTLVVNHSYYDEVPTNITAK